MSDLANQTNRAGALLIAGISVWAAAVAASLSGALGALGRVFMLGSLASSRSASQRLSPPTSPGPRSGRRWTGSASGT